MDTEKTAPFELGRGEDACLLFHGFTGSPWDMRPLGEHLARAGYYVRGIRLPGHGLSPEAMRAVTYRDWEQAAEEALESLRHFRQVFVAGLSMGSLLGMMVAARHPERVHGLALLAPAVRFKGPLMAVLKATRQVPWLEWVKPWVAKTASDISDAGVLAQAPILPRFPSARLHDLWELQELAAQAAPLVRAPTLIAVARHDHVVDPAAGRALGEQLTQAPEVRFLEMQEGFHIMPRDVGGRLVAESVADFFDRLKAPLPARRDSAQTDLRAGD